MTATLTARRGDPREAGCAVRTMSARLWGRRAEEGGQISLLILGFSLIAISLIIVTVAVTSVHMSRTRLLDTADGAALAAANSFSTGGYGHGMGDHVPLSDAMVQQAAADYVSARPLPGDIVAWRIVAPTGAPDADTAQVTMTAVVQLPLVGGLADAMGSEVTITVTSVARADVE